VFAQCIGEEPWPAIITKVMASATCQRPIYKVEFINHKSVSNLEGEWLMKYDEKMVKEQTKRQKKRGSAGRNILNAIKAANKMVKQANMHE
jgi:hypothetical protein